MALVNLRTDRRYKNAPFFTKEQIAAIGPGTQVTVGHRRSGFPEWQELTVVSRKGNTFYSREGIRFTVSNISLINGQMPGDAVGLRAGTSATDLVLLAGAAYLLYRVVRG